MIPNLNLIKSCSTKDTTVGDKITYTISSTNEGGISFEDIIITDVLSHNLKFIRGSLKINNIDMPKLNIITGVSIGKLGIGRTTLVSFDVEVIFKDLDVVGTTAMAEAFYRQDNMSQTIVVKSIPCSINVNEPKLHITTYTDKDVVRLDDTITYTIKFVNNGDVRLDYIRIKDKICDSLEIIEGSFKINGNVINEVDLNEGINIGSIDINKYSVISYDAKVIGKGISCKVKSKVIAKYGYRLSNGNSGYKCSESNESNISIALDSFKQISIADHINLSPQKNDIDYINNIDTKVVIKEYHPIKTPVATSMDGQVLSGYKLIVHGKINQVIQYTVRKSDQRVHYLENECVFSSFVVLPCNYKIGDPIQVEGIVEHIYHNLVNPRYIIENIDVLLVVKTLR